MWTWIWRRYPAGEAVPLQMSVAFGICRRRVTVAATPSARFVQSKVAPLLRWTSIMLGFAWPYTMPEVVRTFFAMNVVSERRITTTSLPTARLVVGRYAAQLAGSDGQAVRDAAL